jgi:hypothetical protein
MDVTAPIRVAEFDPPSVLLLGRGEHADFVDAVAALRVSARVTTAATVDQAVAQLAGGAIGPELIVLAQSRPGVVRVAEVELLLQAAPLACIVALAGSWCEGELRTGRPLPGVRRLYWYEFTPWWQRQLRRHAAGLCPDWARPAANELADMSIGGTCVLPMPRGLVVLATVCWDTADALADLVGRAGLATVWQPPGNHGPCVWGASAGIWEGGQLDRREQQDLATFRRWLGDRASVVALLDFPRRSAVERAREAGADVVLGKPWLNVDLLQSLARRDYRGAVDTPRVVARAA